MGKKPPPPRPSPGDMEYGIPIQSLPQMTISPPPPPPPQKSWFPWLVPLIFVFDVAAFVYTMYLNDCPSTTPDCILQSELGRFSFQPFSQNPLFGPSTNTLEKLGALEWKLVVRDGQAWRLISCIWLHAGVVHLVANMMSLLFVGVRLEQEFGFLRVGILFVLSGFGGSLLSSLNLRATISVGASGALFGLLGAMLSELFTNWSIYANKCAALFTLIFVITLNLAVSILPHVDSSAHIGGFISGFLLGFVLLIRPQFGWVNRKYLPPGYNTNHMKSKHKCYQYFFCVVSAFILVAGYAIGLNLLFKGKTSHMNLQLPHIS